MRLSYGRIEENTLSLYDPLSPDQKVSSPGEGIIISASDSHLYIVPTQLSKDEQIQAFISQYIKSIHPGPYDNLVTDYYVRGSGKKKNIILCLMEKEILEIYRRQGKPLYYLFQLVKQPGTFSFSLNEQYEVFEIGQDSLDSYETRTLPSDTMDISKGKHTLRPIKSFSRPVFTAKKESRLWPVLAAILLSGLLLISILDLISLNQERSALNNSLKMAREHQKKIVAAARKDEITSKESSPFLHQMTAITDSIPMDSYAVLQSIAQTVNRKVLISNLVLTEKRIDLRGETDNALKLVSDLYTTGLFQEITPSNIQPSTEGNKEQFNITGLLK